MNPEEHYKKKAKGLRSTEIFFWSIYVVLVLAGIGLVYYVLSLICINFIK